MKSSCLRNSLLLFAVALFSLGHAVAQTLQPGDFVVTGTDWYRADGTHVLTLACGHTFCDWGAFDPQGYFYRVNQDNTSTAIYISVDKYDSGLNYLSTIVHPTYFGNSSYGGPMFLDAKGNIYLVLVDYVYGTGYEEDMLEYNLTGTYVNAWGLGYSLGTWADLYRDEKTTFIGKGYDETLNLKTFAKKSLGTCGGTGEIRVMPDETYLGLNVNSGAGVSEMDHCTAKGKLIKSYPSPDQPPTDYWDEFVALEPDGQSFLAQEYVSGKLYRVDLASGSATLVTTALPGDDLQVFGSPSVGTAPLLPNSFASNLGSITVGTTSSPKTFTFANISTYMVPVVSVGLSGANAGDFAVTGDTCTGANLKPKQKCSVTMTFTPGAKGVRSASLNVAYTGVWSPVGIALSGKGL